MRKITQLFLSCVLLTSMAGIAAPAPPNIVIIFMDDMGYGDPVCYGGGPYRTPNIDALASQGMRLTNFYAAQAVCSASRSALMTGCYPTRIGISGAFDHNAAIALNPKEETIAELLKDRGYATGMVGKWHLGNRVPFLPLQQGFDEYLGLPYSNDMWPVYYDGTPYKYDTANYRSTYPMLPLIDGNTTTRTLNTLDDQATLTKMYTERAVSFINKNKKKPFFLYLAHSMVHVPIAASPAFKGKSGAGLFGDVMEEVDWSVGEVLKALQENQLEDNTIVIFTSDNGPWLNYGNHAGSSGGLREGKGTAWDGGLKVPAIISWPGKIKPGIVSSKLLSTIDILPTLVKICGAKMPVQKIDGVDFSKHLLGDDNFVARDEFAYYYDYNNLKAIRKGPWKLVFPASSRSYSPPATIGNDGFPGEYSTESVPLALYNLYNDPGEDRDQKDQYPEVVKQLSKIADKYRQALGDGLTKSVGTEVRPAATVR
ncbi:sulfatase family protein [Flavihumibacter fluvii]|uniref:sulfatase family protein n=1 Tax=Flavihumibacter fluvii TaxID=2838157 RepID=UPI001BDF467E|nr:sulfatase [Flavihumibacter fluvii]ULQ51002.1 sulfatase [Flavihumibacter fluvii]